MVIDVLSIISEKFTEMDELTDTDVVVSAGVTRGCARTIDDTVGATVSMVKEVRVIVFPAFPAESVTVTVQLS